MYQHETHTTVTTFRDVGYVLLRRELVKCWFNYHFRVWAPNFAKSFVRNLHPFLHYCPITYPIVYPLPQVHIGMTWWSTLPVMCTSPPSLWFWSPHCLRQCHWGTSWPLVVSPIFCCWPIHQQCCDGPVERVYSGEVGCQMLMAALWVIEEYVLHALALTSCYP